MRKFPIFLACLGLALPLQAAKRVSLEQLDEVIAQAASKPDTDLAWQIGDVQLTERISATGLAKLLKALPGEKSRQALTAVADASQFLGLPSASVPQNSVQLSPGVSPFAVQAELDSLPPGERQEVQDESGKSQRNVYPGRISDQMKQDMHPIQGPVRDLAEAVFRRCGDIAGVADGRAAYSLSFTPDFPADDAYHHLTVKVVGRNDLKLRYRTGYLYGKEPATMKERLREAVWQPTDTSEVGVTATPERTANGVDLKLNIAATDLGMAQQNGRWADKVDVFLVERDDSTMHAKLSGKRLGLNLKPATYQQLLHDGVAFEEHVALTETSSDLRILVVDENTGRIGSVTFPVKATATFR